MTLTAMRCGTSTKRLGAAAMRSAPAVKIKQAVISTGLRPHCWLARPLTCCLLGGNGCWPCRGFIPCYQAWFSGLALREREVLETITKSTKLRCIDAHDFIGCQGMRLVLVSHSR